MNSRERYPFRDVEASRQGAGGEEAAAGRGKGSAPGGQPGPPASWGKHYIFPWPAALGSGRGRGNEPSGAFLRRWVVADTLGRFLAHRSQKPFRATALDGFAPEVRAAALAEGTSPLTIVQDARHRLAELEQRLAIETSEPHAATSDPAYYRFSQWIFLQLHARGLVVRSSRWTHHCGACGRDFPRWLHGVCPTCKGELVEEERRDWRVDLRPFCERLADDIEKGNWTKACRREQRDLIGRRRGTEVVFHVSRLFDLEASEIVVFTTRVEMIFGATFLLVDPYHPVIESILDPTYADDLERYRERLRKGMEPRLSAARTGGFALNPANLQRIPILASPLANNPFSDGIVMAVPAHDRDLFDLARRVRLPVREVIHNDKAKFDSRSRLEEPWLGDGVLTNSASFTSLPAKVGRDRIISFLARRGICRRTTRYRLQGMAISSTAAWGPPVPLVHCEACGIVPLPEGDLPLELLEPPPAALAHPERGLAAAPDFLGAPCPRCGAHARRDAETLLPWLGTAWSYLRPLVPELGGAVEGFRDPSRPPPAPAAAPGPSAPPDSRREQERQPAAARSVPAAAAYSAPAATYSAPAASRAAAAPAGTGAPDERVLPEDVDIFRALPAKGPEPARTEALVEAVLPAVEDGGRKELGGAEVPPPGTVPQGAEALGGAPAASGFPGAAPGPEPVDIAPAGAATAELPASQPAGGGPGAGGPGDGGPAEPRPAGPGPEHEDLEPEDIVRTPEAAAGGEDQGGDDELPQEAAAPLPEPVLRPFRGHDVRGLLPVDAGLGSSRQHAKDLIAVRFLCKFLYEIGEIPVFEPFRRYRQVGDVRWRAFPGARGGSDGKAPPAAEKAHGAMGAGGPAAAGMPAAPTTPVAAAVGAGEILDRCGADALRLFFLAGGPLAAAIRPDSGALQGVRRFLDRVWRQFGTRLEKGKFVSRRVLVAKHLLIHEVTGRLARWSVHTAVASLMKFVRFLGHPETTPEEMDRNAMETFLVVLSPFAPYLAEELWRRMGKEGPLREAAWPVASDELVHPPEREFPIFLEGKVRDRMLQPTNLEAEKLESRALGRERIRELIGTRKVAKVVVVPGRLVSIALEGQPAVPAGSSS